MHCPSALFGARTLRFACAAWLLLAAPASFAQAPTDAPADLRAIVGDRQLTFYWSPVSGATGYRYRLKAGNAAYTAWTAVAGAATSHVATGLTNGTTYKFKVRAVNGNRSGPSSGAISAVPRAALAAPARLTATAGDGRATLSWAAVATATGYDFRQKQAAGAYGTWAAMVLRTATSTTHVITRLRNGIEYTFQVRATRTGEHGPPSPEATAKPEPPCGGATTAALVRDCKILLAAKATLDPNGKLNWAREAPLSTWTGVTTGTMGITALRVPKMGLGGSVPASLGRLVALKALNLSGNDLTRSIPSTLDSLTELEHLDLSGNRLTGNIPALAALNQLKTLRLNDNGLRGAIPGSLGSLSNLEYLVLWGNQLAETLPSQLRNLDKLKDLHLYDNQLRGTMPTWLGSLTALTRLNLGKNDFEGAIPALGGLTKLTALTVGGRGDITSGAVPAWLDRLKNLEYLSLYNVGLTGAIPPSLGGLTKLKTLSLADNALEGAIPEELNDLTRLEALDLHDNQLSKSIPTLSGLTKLKTLTLSGNKLSGNIPAWLGSLRNLELLWLHDNKLEGDIPAQLGNLRELKHLHLGSNQLTNAIPPALGSLSNLEHLELAVNQLAETVPGQLANLSKLKTLQLQNNRLHGTIPTWLGSLTAMERMNLGSNDFTGAIPALGRLTKLRELTLGGRGVMSSGAVPTWLADLKELEYLNLRNVGFTDAIPSTLASLTALTYLGLAYNQFEGTIPDALGDLPKLATLYLMDNRLTGCIPSSLASHADTINPQQGGRNLCVASASGGAAENTASSARANGVIASRVRGPSSSTGPLAAPSVPPAGAMRMAAATEALYGEPLRLPLASLIQPSDGGELAWRASSSDEAIATVRIVAGDLVVEPEPGTEGVVLVALSATDADGQTTTVRFEVRVEFYWPSLWTRWPAIVRGQP